MPSTEISEINRSDYMIALNLPNLLTILRITLIPVFVLAYYVPSEWSYFTTTGIFIFAGLTDWLDGYLARKLKQESTFGAFLDPVADKLIVVVALVLLVESFSTWFLSIPAMIIISREILISALRELMAENGKRGKVAVAYIGKVKTFFQIASIALLLSQPHILDLQNNIVLSGFVLLYLSVILTLWSMLMYLHASWQVIWSNK